MSCKLAVTHQSFGGTHCYCLQGRIMRMETAGHFEALALISDITKTKFRGKHRLRIPRNVRNPTFYYDLHRCPPRLGLWATFRYILIFEYEELSASRPTHRTGGPPLVGYPRLLTEYIRALKNPCLVTSLSPTSLRQHKKMFLSYIKQIVFPPNHTDKLFSSLVPKPFSQ